MINNYLLKDLDEFKIRYVKNRIKNKLYVADCNNNIIIECYNNNLYDHKFIVTNNSSFIDKNENILLCRKLKSENIYEIISSPMSIKNNKNDLYLFNWRLNKLLQYLSLDKKCSNYKDDEYLSWLYHINIKELEKIRKIYFYDKSIVPYENISIKELNLEYETIPYSMDIECEVDSIPENNRLENTIKEINKRQVKSKIKANDIYIK